MICVSLLQIFSSRDVQDQLSKIQNLLNDTNSAWEKRCDAVCTDYLHFLSTNLYQSLLFQNTSKLSLNDI